MFKDFSKAEALMRAGQEDGVYPGAALSVGDAGGELFRAHCGFRAYFPEKEPMERDTLFDVASMTKIMATSMVALKFIEYGKLNLDDKLSCWFDCPSTMRGVTIWHLMTHTSGLPAHIDLWTLADNDPSKVTDVIVNLKPLYAPGEEVTYSCLGFILLARICEDIGGAGLHKLAESMIFEPLGMSSTIYNPADKSNIASTEFNEELNCYIKGVVHDENARFLGGVSGNAGIFSNINDCAIFANMLSNRGVHNGLEFINRDLFNLSVQNHTVGLDEGRGLGFVVKAGLPSSAGNIFPDGSYGHTGFTGTSVWVDAETSQYTVFLTNRVHPTRLNDRLVQFRKDMNDACAVAYRG